MSPGARGADLTATAVHPDARLARTNLALERRRVDGAYLAGLSADAVPVVLRGLDGLGRNARCTVARTYVDRWGPDAVSPDGDDWRTWNAATARARSAVRALLPELRTTADACG